MVAGRRDGGDAKHSVPNAQQQPMRSPGRRDEAPRVKVVNAAALHAGRRKEALPKPLEYRFVHLSPPVWLFLLPQLLLSLLSSKFGHHAPFHHLVVT